MNLPTNIQEQHFDQAFEAHPDAKVVVGSGKGGVGKTTTNAGVLLALSRMKLNVFGCDLDGSPSLELLTAAKRPQGTAGPHMNPVAVSECEGRRLHVAQSSVVIPDLHPEVMAKVEEQLTIINDESVPTGKRKNAVRLAENIIKDEYKRLADALLPGTIDDVDSYLPLLRPALQPVAWNLGNEMKNLATAIQLVELLANRRHLVFDLTHMHESVTAKKLPVARADIMLLDTENAHHLTSLLQIIRKFRIFLGTLSAATGNFSTWGVATMLANSGEGEIFKGFYKDKQRRHPEAFLAGATKVADTLRGPETFIVQTVNPATAVTEQTLADVQRLLNDGVCPNYFVMTRWPQARGEQGMAQEIETDFLTKLSAILRPHDRTVGYKRLEETGIEPRVRPESETYEATQHRNMQIMADALVRR